MTQFTALRPVFWTENLDETITFYMNVLGFTLMGRNDDWQWASLRKMIYTLCSPSLMNMKTIFPSGFQDHFTSM